MRKEQLIQSILDLMVSKGYFKKDDSIYNIYKGLMKTDTIGQLKELQADVERDIYIIF